MAILIDHLDQLLPAFEEWYVVDHGPNENFYDKQITLKKLSTISDENLIEFFVKFRREGGHIQSGGKRSIKTFEKMLQENVEGFRKHILKPFYTKFDLNEWIDELGQFKQWGIGIATIYLVRVDKRKYPVLNNKTIKGLKCLGFKDVQDISNSANVNKNIYSYVNDIQSKIIYHYPQIDNYYKADALCHYAFAEHEGKNIVKNILKLNKKQISSFVNNLEQDRASNSIQSDKELLSKEQLIARINEIDDKDSEKVKYSGKYFKRDVYKIELIKQLRGYKCQFCGRNIVKRDGNLYIEACHIKPKSHGGNESLSNILILCPNCHKEFDLGNRNEIEYNEEKYIVEVNGMEYTIIF